MGYSSTIKKFEQFQFQLPLGTTAQGVANLFQNGTNHREYFEEVNYWFDFEVDEDGYFSMEPNGEPAKAYMLPESLDVLIKILSPLQTEEQGGLEGLRFRFELWGEEAGDVVLYISDGKQLFSIQGELIFPGERVPVVS